MRRFTDFAGDTVKLSRETEKHISSAHSEITSDLIAKTLEDPDELRNSSYNAASILYYRLKIKKRYICVVVKKCSDGFFISTAMTTTKPKSGEVIYVREK
jgi:hypothetical protein